MMIDPVSTKLSATEIIADPHRFHAALASQGGLVWNTSHKAWLVGNYEHVRLLLKSSRRFSGENRPVRGPG